jgi:hypothetical protein
MSPSPLGGAHYPRSLGEFQAWFSIDADCSIASADPRARLARVAQPRQLGRRWPRCCVMRVTLGARTCLQRSLGILGNRPSYADEAEVVRGWLAETELPA